MRLKTFLANKPIYYKEFTYDTIVNSYNSIKNKLNLENVVHIVGTNAKGSTGRFLTQILNSNSLEVGHFTSPHISSFNERIYIKDRICTDDELEKAHEFLLKNLSSENLEKLSYFEYSFLLSCVIFNGFDYSIMEAGMGGELDATNVLDKKLTLFTPIGLDHIPKLGNNLKEIATTKFNAMQNNAILSNEMNSEILPLAKEIAKKKSCNLFFAKDFLNKDDEKDILEFIKIHSLPKFQISNLCLSVAGARFLNQSVDLSKINGLDLPGRMQKIAKNITIDVGHNELAAKAIANEFAGKKIVLIYNAFKDKDIDKVLSCLKNIIKRVEILPYQSQRELATKEIENFLIENDIKFSEFKKIDKDEQYLVFGSFLLVEEFLKNVNK